MYFCVDWDCKSKYSAKIIITKACKTYTQSVARQGLLVIYNGISAVAKAGYIKQWNHIKNAIWFHCCKRMIVLFAYLSF